MRKGFPQFFPESLFHETPCRSGTGQVVPQQCGGMIANPLNKRLFAVVMRHKGDLVSERLRVSHEIPPKSVVENGHEQWKTT